MTDSTDRSFRQDGLTTAHLKNDLGKAFTTGHLAGRLGSATPPPDQGGSAPAVPHPSAESAPAPAPAPAAVPERKP